MDNTISIREISDHENQTWNQFVFTTSGATPNHVYQWKKIIREGYDLETRFMGAFRGEELRAVFPSAIIQLPFGRRKAISLPYCNYAGILAAEGEDTEQCRIAFVNDLLRQGVEKVELRQLATSGAELSTVVTMVRELGPSSSEVWKSLEARARQVRRALKEGLTVRWGKEQLDDFYDIYSQNMRSLGTPVHARRFFSSVLACYPGLADIVTVRLQDRPVASMFVIGYRDRLVNAWASSLRKHDRLFPGMLLYWEVIRYACDGGYVLFDMGRSDINSGTYQYKKQWGATPVPLDYRTYTSAGLIQSSSVDLYHSLGARTFAQLWMRLPKSMTSSLGPRIRKFLP